MRALKITLLATLLVTVTLVIVLAGMVRSEEGSSWLLEKGLALSPVAIEVNGVRGNLADGLAVEQLKIQMPVANLHAQEIVVSWSPVALLAGVLRIDSASIAELSIDLVQGDDNKESPDDRLFWLNIPLLIYIESGQLDRLRIEEAEFESLRLTGGIGHGRLNVESLVGQIAGANLSAEGELTGPAPGHLQASGTWELPAAKLGGQGQFSGNIEELAVTHVLTLPDEVHFNGSIDDLFGKPTLEGFLEWQAIRLPVATVISSAGGKVAVSSDFLTARLQGAGTVLLEGWPQAPLQLDAVADLQEITINEYILDALGGQLSGSGQINYRNGVSGQLQVNGSKIDTRLVNDKVPGRLDFDSNLRIVSTENFSIDVAGASGLLLDNEFTGQGSVQWRAGKLSAIDAAVMAGANQATVDVQLGSQLAGAANANLPDLAQLWPGLKGSLEAAITFGGSLEMPQFKLTGEAASLSYGAQSLETLRVSGELGANSKLNGTLVAAGLSTGEQKLGDLKLSLRGSLDEFQTRLKLAGDIADVELRSEGRWDGEQLSQRFSYGRVQPAGFDSWELDQAPELLVSASGGQVAAHCWKQAAAGICVEASAWEGDSLHGAVSVDNFALATLKPLLAEGYSIDGSIDANLEVRRDGAGLRGELHWRQSRMVLGYADDIDEFTTEFDQVQIDLTSTDEQSSFSASISGAEGLTLVATAEVIGPLAESSPLVAAARGTMPSIGLLRPLVQRIVHPGELQGRLNIDLDVAGTLGDPVFMGGAYLTDGALGLVDAGVTLRDINIAAESKASDKLLVTGEMRSGEGRAEIYGDIHSELNSQGNPRLIADIGIKGENLEIVRSTDLRVETSPDLMLHAGDGIFDVTGTIVIPRARAQIRELPENAVARSKDVIVHVPEQDVEADSGTIITGDITVLLGNDVRFKGFGLDSRLEGSLKLKQKRGGFLRSAGTVRVRDGFLTGYGKELRVDRGDLTFTGPLDDPVINIQVSRESVYEGRQYTVGLRLSGTAQNVRTEPFSRPAMSDNDVLAFLLIDQPAGSGGAASGAAVAMGLGQLMPGDGGMLGLDEVSFETNDANQAAMVAGKRINDNVYVRYVFGSAGEPGAFRIRYRLGKGFSLEASTGSGSQQSLDLIYLLER